MGRVVLRSWRWGIALLGLVGCDASGAVSGGQLVFEAGAHTDAAIVCLPISDAVLDAGPDAALEGGADAAATEAGADAAHDAARDATIDGATPGAAPTFTQVYADIINGPPGCNGCHSPAGGPTGNLDMSSQATAYKNLVGNPPTSAPLCASETSLKLVDPGVACNSLIYLKVTMPPCGAQMPFGGTPLTPAQYSLIGRWINAGAKND